MGYLARLGSFTFSLDTAAFQTIERSTGYKWAKTERIGRNPALQFTGREPESFTLAGTIYPHFRGGLGQMGTLREMAASGEPHDLYVCDTQAGDRIGRFVIESVKESRSVMMSNGAPRKIDFSLTLTEYGD